MAHLLVHLLVPHPSNNHRAKVLHIDAFFLYVIAFLVFQIVTSWVHTSYPDVLGYATDIRVSELLNLTNAKRQEAGLSPVSLNEKLSQAAAMKASDMFAKNYWAHTSPEGKLPWDFIIGAGYKYSVAGENLAKNFSDSSGVVEAWMVSQSHRDNLMKPSYRDIGFAVVNGVLNGEETTLVVEMFGTSPTEIIAQAPQPLVKEVKAQEKTVPPVSQITSLPSPITVSKEKEPTLEPVDVSRRAIATSEYPKSLGLSFDTTKLFDFVQRPLLNLTSVNRSVTMIFLGFLLGVTVLDLWIVHKRKIVRVAGRSLAHILFFSMILILLSRTTAGSIL